MNSGSARDHSQAHSLRGGESARRAAQVSSHGPRQRLVERSPTPSLPFRVCLCRRSSDPRWAHGSASAVCKGWVAHAPLPDVRGGHPGLRSLGDVCALPSMAPLAAYAGFWGVGNPSFTNCRSRAVSPPRIAGAATQAHWKRERGARRAFAAAHARRLAAPLAGSPPRRECARE